MSTRFSDVNTYKMCPMMPYHDPDRPFVDYWFASSDGAVVNTFNKCISERNQDRLEEEHGACIMYTHFAKGFYENKGIDARFKFLIERLSKKNGWFVPVYKLLDYVLEAKGRYNITKEERTKLERIWILDRAKSKLKAKN